MNYALIKNGIVENVIVAGPEFISTLAGYDHIEALDAPEEQKVAGPGWLYNAETGAFTEPTKPEPTSRRMTRLDFFELFTDAELIGILDASKVNTQVELWVKKLDAAIPEADGTCVDLKDLRTIIGVQALEAAGLIGVGRAEEILNA